MIEIDFEALKHADFEVINNRPTEEELRQFSAFLKELRVKEAKQGETHTARSRKLRPLPADERKNVRAAAK